MFFHVFKNREKCSAKSRKVKIKSESLPSQSDLIHLSAQHLFPVVIIRQEELQDVEQAPEGLLLVQEEEGDGGDPVESLTILDIWVVEAVRQQDSS